MINTAYNMPRPRQAVQVEVQALAGDVAAIQEQMGRLGDRLEEGERNLEPARQEVVSTQWPLMRAERDDAQHDVSADGRELGGLLSSVGSRLNRNSGVVLGVETAAGELGQVLIAVRKRVDTLREHVSHAEVAAALGQASGGLTAAGANVDRVGQGAARAYARGADAQLETVACSPLTAALSADKPGLDVSVHARLLEGRVGTIRYDLDDARSELNEAERQHLQGRDQTNTAQEALQRALQVLVASGR